MTSGLARLAVELPAEHGEGPVWDSVHECLLWVDLTEGKLHSFHPATGTVETRTFDEPVCAVAPHADGRLLVAFAKRMAWVDWNSGAISATICKIEPDLPGNRVAAAVRSSVGPSGNAP